MQKVLAEYFDHCRLCLVKLTAEVIDLDRVLIDQIEELVGQIDSSKDFPNKICSECQVRLDDSYRFKVQVDETQRELVNLMRKKPDSLMIVDLEFSEKLNQCTLCQRIFKERRDLTLHIQRVHERRKDHECDLCDYRCFKKFDMQLHHRNIHAKGSFDLKVLCPECGRSMRNPSDLRRHQKKQHLKIKRFNCEFCDFSSFESAALKVHSKTHQPLEERDLRFACDVCGKLLSTKSTLEAHISNIHEDVKLFACNFCSKSFAQKSCLMKHIKGVHQKAKEFQCDICKVFVSQACYLKKHKLMMHPQNGIKVKHPCKVCSQTFTTEQALRNHEKKHRDPEFECSECLKKFHHKANLLDHQEHHQQLRFPCENCTRSFRKEAKLRNHQIRVHFKEKTTFRCEICSSTFTRRTTYRDHVLRQHKDLDKKYSNELIEKIARMQPEEKATEGPK